MCLKEWRHDFNVSSTLDLQNLFCLDIFNILKESLSFKFLGKCKSIGVIGFFSGESVEGQVLSNFLLRDELGVLGVKANY